MFKQSYDAIVIGGGPAGATTSTLLAKEGLDVLLLEKQRFPRYSIGESLIPYCYFTLERLGILPKIKEAGYVKKQSVQFVSTSGKQSTPFYFEEHMKHDASTTWQVDRSSFDVLMLEHAIENGVEVHQETRVRSLIEDANKVTGVQIENPNKERFDVSATITIDCSGRDAFAMSRNRWRIPEKSLKKTAIWNYFKGAIRDTGIDEGATTIAYIPEKGWFWYIPLANDIVSVGLVAEKDYLFKDGRDLESVFKRETKNNAWIADRLAPATPIKEYQATGDYSYRSKHCAKEGLLLVGDAFSFLDPVFSSGVFLALSGGSLAADAVLDCFKNKDFHPNNFQEYADTYRNGIEAMRKFVYAFYDESFSMGAFLKTNPHLMGDVTDCLIGNVFKDLSALFKAFDEFAALPQPLQHGAPLAAAT